MGWDPSIFFAAFERAGMLSKAVLMPPSGVALAFDVDYRQPDQVVLEGMVHSTDYSIEYQAADVDLKRDDLLQVAGQSFRVRQTPLAKGNGFFMIALLEKVTP